MLKQSVRLVSLLWAFGLPFSSQLLLASEPPVLPNTSYNLVAQRTDRREQRGESSSLWRFSLHGVLPPIPIWDPKSPLFLPEYFYLYNSVTQPTRLEISLSHRRVTVYKGKSRIKSYPIAVGRRGWETPTGNFRVRQMLRNPTWIHPFTGVAIAGGSPDNPLGHYWIGFWTDGKNSIGFHGTPNPKSVGKAASHGCIRMYNKDIEELFHQVSLGTTVTVVR